MNTARHLATLFLLIMLLISPWWFFGMLATIFISIFPKYYESVGLALIGDLIYATMPDGEILNILATISSYLYTLSALLVVIIMEKIKTYVIFYK